MKKRENRIIVGGDYKKINVEKFMRMIGNRLKGNNINDIANLTINAIVECLDVVASRKKNYIKKISGKESNNFLI